MNYEGNSFHMVAEMASSGTQVIWGFTYTV